MMIHKNGPVPAVPHDYNAATEFIDRNIALGRHDRIAVVDERGEYSYAELATMVNQAGNALTHLDINNNERVLMAMLDTVEFPAVFWGCIKAGITPIPLNTLLTTPEYEYILEDSKATTLIVSDTLFHLFKPIIEKQCGLKNVLVCGKENYGYPLLGNLLINASTHLEAAQTKFNDIAFWLYSSGSTGKPKGVMHRHENLFHTAELYGQNVLGINENDIVYSAAKLFFAYGLGNAMTFPFYVGATAVLFSGRPTPDTIMSIIHKYKPTIYFGVPGLYAAMLANIDEPVSSSLRLCVSAGEALPEHIGRKWEKIFGVPILDGIGSTEMLHIYLSHQLNNDYYGTTGIPVPGYEVMLVDEEGNNVQQNEIGELLINGPSVASGYWMQEDKTRDTFRGDWLHSGDKYTCNNSGYYVYSGRKDDMFKVSGQWVSPFEIESTIMQFPDVLEAAVIARSDENELLKPMAFIVLNNGTNGSEKLANDIQKFVKQKISLHKYPRWIEFVSSLPKTATGKIQRFKLRDKTIK
ncbi:MAG: benzoate-CoA ligase family protein [Gammaproteobacteria bacterium]|jgi:benzoate-CoA ligase family protein